MSKELSAFTKKLRTLMQEKNMSVEDLAQKSGLSEEAVYNLYSGLIYKLDTSTLETLARALGVAVNSLN